MMSNRERLVYMANQIARNFAALGHDNAVAATADHIASFWDPRMRETIFACGADDGLGDLAGAAVARLRAGAQPAPQTPVTQLSGGSDAG
ncbi:formate dehydrogenase subunit delta [Sphingobium subterraneum]|uniref:Formate dehydrogenase subunit delta n=1 Tax=Sphingobium subterraneum TaxID=627688 RepID=A0A841J9C1_9SPHN|nr:formate dehydrogenase subunit delta [Sphingobium subterraneum]MBB6125148.1 formate dehydrogenase subunit delta [Sphingobium subterraneum]